MALSTTTRADGTSELTRPGAVVEPRPRMLIVLRAGISVAVAVVVTAVVRRLQSGPLDVHTDIIGYPIFADFDVTRYYHNYQDLALVFPALALLGYWVLGFVGPMRATRASRYRPVEHAESPVPATRAALGMIVRLGVTGFVIGAEVLAVTGGNALACFSIAMVAYPIAVWAAAQLPVPDPGRPLWIRMARISALGSVLPVAGLYFVSRSTEVVVLADGSHSGRPWLPLWLAVALTVASAAIVGISLHRAELQDDPDRGVIRVERFSVLGIAAAVGVFLTAAQVPGALGPIDLFHEGELLVASSSLLHGAVPWRDSLSIHGLLNDYLTPLLGRHVFEDSRWGMWTGLFVIVFPLYWTFVWWTWAWFLRRVWPLLLAVPLIAVVAPSSRLAPLFGGAPQIRFLLQPLILLTLVAAFRRRSRWRSVIVGVLLAVQFIVTPEGAFTIAAVAAAIILFDLYHRAPGSAWPAAMSRTLWTGVGGFVTVAAFGLVLLVTGILDDYLDYFLTFARGHDISGGIPIQWGQGFNWFWIILPAAAAVGLTVFVLVRGRSAGSVSTDDWAMLAVALFTLLYYKKFLARADAGHFFEVASTASILLVYLGARLCLAAGERLARVRVRPIRLPVTSVALVVAIAAVLYAHPSIRPTLRGFGTRLRANVAQPATDPRLGYFDDPTNGTAFIQQVGAALEGARLQREDVFDFTNSPAIFYYLLPFDPPSKFEHVSMAIPARAQEQLISDLGRRRPPVVVIDSTTHGLPGWDGVANTVRHHQVSAWILEHYKPWISVDGYQMLQRADLDLPDPDTPGVAGAPGGEPADSYFVANPCAWGSTPTFLDSKGPQGDRRLDLAGVPVVSTVSVSGWLADHVDGSPPQRVGLVDGSGTVLAATEPSGDRPDVAARYGRPSPSENGFALTAGLAGDDQPEDLRIALLDERGTVLETSAPLGALGTPGAVSGPFAVGAFDGTIDSVEARPISTGLASVERVAIPADAHETYGWLEATTAGAGSGAGHYVLSDVPDPALLSHTISFNSLPRSPSRQLVPVGSCPQWYGFGPALYVSRPPGSTTTLSLRS